MGFLIFLSYRFGTWSRI